MGVAMTDVDRLAMYADVPRPLARIVVQGAEHFGWPLAAIRGPRRVPILVEARWAIACQARKRGFTYWQIGRAMNRDHSSIVHAVQQSAMRANGGEW